MTRRAKPAPHRGRIFATGMSRSAAWAAECPCGWTAHGSTRLSVADALGAHQDAAAQQAREGQKEVKP